MLNEKTRNEFPRYVPLWRNPRFTSFTTGHSITMDSLEEKAESGHVRICTCVYVYNPRFSDTPLPPPFFFKNEIVINLSKIEVHSYILRTECGVRLNLMANKVEYLSPARIIFFTWSHIKNEEACTFFFLIAN